MADHREHPPPPPPPPRAPVPPDHLADPGVLPVPYGLGPLTLAEGPFVAEQRQNRPRGRLQGVGTGGRRIAFEADDEGQHILRGLVARGRKGALGGDRNIAHEGPPYEAARVPINARPGMRVLQRATGVRPARVPHREDPPRPA